MQSADLRGGVDRFHAILLAGTLLLLASLADPALAAKPEPGTIGVNLSALYSWGEQIPFVDVFKQSAPWTLHSAQGAGSQTVSLDADGWVAHLNPGEVAETTIFTGSQGRYPAGRYTLLYAGRGTLNVSGSGVTIVASSPGRILLDVQPTTGANNGIRIQETALDPAAPIKNIRLFLPGFDAEPKGNPFNPAFLKVIQPFKVVRFIGWTHIVRSETSSWSDERPASYATQASVVTATQKMTGVALEYQIQLANLLHVDPWFLVPLKADDDFIRHMAAMVRTRLDPSLHPYVELSNEIWNAGFPEGVYARAMGGKLGLDPDPNKAAAKWYSSQAVHMFEVWNEAFGADAARTVHVLAGAFPWPPVTDAELGYQDAYKHVDAFAIAPYLDPKSIADYEATARMTPDQVLDAVEADVTGKFQDFMHYHTAFTRKYGVDLIAYEGGPGLMSARAPAALLPQINKVLLDATESPRMAQLYRKMLDEWFTLGGTEFTHFDDCSPPSQWGDFGLIDYQFQDPGSSELFRMLTGYIADDRGPTIAKSKKPN
jgi:hypothetical protein